MDELDLGQTVRGFAPGQKVLNRYTLVRILGRGGMGVVWLARDGQLEVDVALKFLPELLSLDPSAIDDMKRETRRSRELAHRNIVKVYHFELEQELAAISMEYVEGATLAKLKVDQPSKCFSHTALTAWLPDLGDALDYAHFEAKMVHRDLKPANVMIDNHGRVKIADFGIASCIAGSVSQISMGRSSSGTPPYMSPQQAAGRPAQPRDDIYSLGASIYDLLTGKPPFYVGNIQHQVENIVPPAMAERRRELGNSGEPIPQTWEETIAACLAKDPEKRPQSAGEVVERLSIEARPSTRTKVPTKDGSDVQRGPLAGARMLSSRWPLMAAFALLLIFGALTATWYMRHGSEQQRKQAAQAKQEADAGAVARAANARGAVLIKTEPQGAIVTLGDESRKSPATFKRVKVGSWPVKIELDGYEPAEQQVAVEENQITDPSAIKLVRSTGTAQINSTPEGTDFDLVDAVGEHHRGTTPAELRNLPVGQGHVILNRQGAGAHSEPIKISRNEVASIAWTAPAEKSLPVETLSTTPSSTPASVPERNFKNSLGCMMVWIPSLRIWVAESEVTQREFASLMDHNPSAHVAPDLPVDSVTQPEAMEFCLRLSKKESSAGTLPSGYAYMLPTDEQWTTFSGNASLQDAVTSQNGSRTGPAHVKSLNPNEYGLYDTRGNVWEWTRTQYDSSLNSSEIRAEYPFGVVQSGTRKGATKGIDPNGLVLRGGSWRSKGDLLKSTTRGSNDPNLRDNTNGFRIVLAPKD